MNEHVKAMLESYCQSQGIELNNPEEVTAHLVEVFDPLIAIAVHSFGDIKK
jgi:hypothetical protein